MQAMVFAIGASAGLSTFAATLSPAPLSDDALPNDATITAIGQVSPTKLYLLSGEVDTTQPKPAAALALLAGPANPDGLSGKRHILQLDGPMTPARRAALQAAGVRLGDYLPMHAYIASLDAADPAAVAGLGFIRWHAEYTPDLKLAPNLGQRPFTTKERQDAAALGLVSVVVTLFKDEPVAPTVDAITALPNTAVHWSDDIGGNAVLAVTLPLADAALLAGLPAVQFVEDAPEITLRNDTDRWIVQSNQPNVTPLYDNGIRGEGQIVGVIDGRVDRDHCSFLDPDHPIGPLHRKIVAYNTSNGESFHGTHVSGTAVGDAGNATATRGVAYLGRLVCNTIPEFNEGAILARLNQHHSQGARVHTNSWGNDGTTQYDSLCRGFDSFQWDNEDSLSVLAVTNQSVLKNPENAKNLLAVGASQDTPSQAQHCSGGVGPTSDGRRKPEIYAPGCGTNSASSGTACGTTTATGTSMATPAIAGAGLLVRQYFTDGYYPSGSPNPSEAFIPTGTLVKAILLNSAVDMTGVSGYPSNLEGWGRVLAGDALYFPGDARQLVVHDVRNADGLATSETAEYGVSVLGSGERLKITLVWTEPPAAAGAAFASINDLDLEVVAPDFTVYKGNVFSGGVSAPGGNKDDRNNVEQVHIDAPAAGNWTVRVIGAGVNVGAQGYALAATGDVEGAPTGVSIALDTPAPTLLAPGQPLSFNVTINPGDDTIVEGTTLLSYRYDGPDGTFLTTPLTPLGDTLFQATLPAADCDNTPEFFIAASGVASGTITLPRDGAAAPFTALVGVLSTPFQDDLETDQAWTVGSPDDDAITGIWARVDPVGTVAQPEDDHSPEPGTFCWVTGQHIRGQGSGSNDVDDGQTTLTTPLIDVSKTPTARISYWRWYTNDDGINPDDDVFVVDISNDGGETWTNVEVVGPDTPESGGGWFRHEFAVADLVTPTDQIRLRFIASDEGERSVIEAAVDDLLVQAFECDGAPSCPPDWNTDGAVTSDDYFAFLEDFFAGDADFNNDTQTTSDDFFAFLDAFFKGC